ncbi:hypothetical protein GPECTOR_23g146 [Gonium pectorale]|uniref:MYND-type domain-containing protein n=1 Tax=Gonium pectorale TaxID=33097 RepID=A0A150GGU0_GONPE|nr:hypothetical protein GPECTOR_23g146 [Gonium pectorale]|eukprot:KXZ49061.1 hypothetical protein GPECTOR_23g146 [Gonium pectorale]
MSGKTVEQREHRRNRCSCPECGRLFFTYPFHYEGYEGGGAIPPIPLLCDEAPPRGSPVDASEFEDLVRAFRQENYNVSSIGPVSYAKVIKRLGSTFKAWFASPDVCAAAQIATKALELQLHDPAAALAKADAALMKSPLCPDAYFVLARLRARSHEEALELFVTGACNFEQARLGMLSERGWEGCRTAYGYHLTEAPPLKGVMRCMLGAVNTLCRLRMGKEALVKMEVLIKMTPPIFEAPRAGVWSLAPEVVYRASGPCGCLAWLQQHACDEVLRVDGAAVWWVATWALAWAATHQHEGFKWSSLHPYFDEHQLLRGGAYLEAHLDRPRCGADKLRGGLALAAVCVWMPYLLDMLLGDMPIPGGPLPPVAVSVGSVGCQVAYARYCGDLWRQEPGVLDFVRRYRNTYEVFCIITDARSGRDPDMKAFRRFMAPLPHSPPPATPASSPSPPPGPCAVVSPACGIFPGAVMYEGAGLWHGLVDRLLFFRSEVAKRPDPALNEQELQMFTALLDAGCPLDAASAAGAAPCSPHPPLGLALYRGYGPEVARALVKAGADPLTPDVTGMVPLVAAAEQGMWREAQAVFRVRKKLGPQMLNPVFVVSLLGSAHPGFAVSGGPALPATAFELCLVVAAGSTCLPCVAGVIKGCSRCTDDDDEDGFIGVPHGPFANFKKFVEVLVAYGMKSVPKPLLVKLRKHVSEMPHPAVRLALLDHLEGLLQEAAAAGGGGGGGAVAAAASVQPTAATAPSASATAKGPQLPERKQTAAKAAAGQPQKQTFAEAPQPIDASSKTATAVKQRVPGEAQGQRGDPVAAKASDAHHQSLPLAGEALKRLADDAVAASPAGAVVSGGAAKGSAALPAGTLASAEGAKGGDARQLADAMGKGAAPTVQALTAAVDRMGLTQPAEAAGEELVLEPHHNSRHCWACGKAKAKAKGRSGPAGGVAKLSRCSLCRVARYCSADCQHLHWPAHRVHCHRLAAQEAAQGGEEAD